jgi:hypothetical protein
MELRPDAASKVNPASRAGSDQSLYRDIGVILMISWAVRIIFILAMPSAARSTDAYNWETVAATLNAGGNPYQTTGLLTWPPFWFQVIFVISKISTFFSVPFFRVLQLLLIFVESIVIVLLVKLIRRVAPGAPVRLLVILGIAFNPAAILLICQHCNFDVIVALWLLLFMHSLLRYHRTQDYSDWLCACLFLGLGILTKTVPLILFPLLAGGFRKVLTPIKFLGLVLLLGPVALGMSIIYVLAPDNVTTYVLEYKSQGSFFGISGLLHLAGLDEWIGLDHVLFYLLLFATMAACFILSWRRQSIGNRETVLLAALLLMGIPVLGPGFATQYLYWYLPFLIASYAFFEGKWRVTLAAFALIAVITYVVEYAILSSDGCYFLNILVARRVDPHPWVPFALFVKKCDTLRGQTLLRLPLFVAYLWLLLMGTGLLLRSIKDTEHKSLNNPQVS